MSYFIYTDVISSMLDRKLDDLGLLGYTYVGSPWSSSTPQSLGRGRVAPLPPTPWSSINFEPHDLLGHILQQMLITVITNNIKRNHHFQGVGDQVDHDHAAALEITNTW